MEDPLEPIRRDLGTALIGLDFDGTLAPIVARPQDARALPAAAAAVRSLAPRVGCLAVITGRPARFVVDQLGLQPGAGVVVLGGYGRERWQDGEYDEPTPPPEISAARADLVQLVASAPAGTELEDKGAGIAVHVRQTADPAAAFGALAGPVSELAARHGLAVELGRLVLEVRPRGNDKGSSLLALARRQRPSGVLFAGDDLGDLAAFDAVEALRSTGLVGVTVCSSSGEAPAVAARADLVVDGPAGLATLLQSLLTPSASS